MTNRRTFLQMIFGGAAALVMPKAGESMIVRPLTTAARPLAGVFDLEHWSFAESFDLSKELSIFVQIPKGDFILNSISVLFEASCPFKQRERACDTVGLELTVGGIKFYEDTAPLWMFARSPGVFAGIPETSGGMELYPSIGMNAGTGISANMVSCADEGDVSQVKGALVFNGLRKL